MSSSRFSRILLASLLLGSSPAFAFQFDCEAIPGVRVDISNASPQPGELVGIKLVNNSGSTLTVPSGCLFPVVLAGDDCSGSAIDTYICAAPPIVVGPFESFTQFWDQTDTAGNPVGLGEYSFPVTYFGPNFLSYSCCVSIEVVPAPGFASCFGVGCPCGNDGAPDGGCANAFGLSAKLSAVGNPDVNADTVQFRVTRAAPSSIGVLFGGDTLTPGMPFGSGLRCVDGQTQRLAIVSLFAGSGLTFGLDVAQLQGLQGGELRHYQFWYRDEASTCTGPFNVTNAYSIQW